MQAGFQVNLTDELRDKIISKVKENKNPTEVSIYISDNDLENNFSGFKTKVQTALASGLVPKLEGDKTILNKINAAGPQINLFYAQQLDNPEIIKAQQTSLSANGLRIKPENKRLTHTQPAIIAHINKIIANGELPDRANFSEADEKSVKAYLLNRRNKLTTLEKNHLLTSKITSEDPRIILKQVKFLMNLGLVPQFESKTIAALNKESQKNETSLGITGDRTSINILQYKILTAAGIKVNLDTNIRDKIKKKLNDSEHPTEITIAYNDPILAKNQFQQAVELGFVPKFANVSVIDKLPARDKIIKITTPQTLKAIALCQSALISGFTFELDPNLKAKMKQQLSKADTIANIHCLDPEEALKRAQIAAELGFIPLLDKESMANVVKLRENLNIAERNLLDKQSAVNFKAGQRRASASTSKTNINAPAQEMLISSKVLDKIFKKPNIAELEQLDAKTKKIVDTFKDDPKSGLDAIKKIKDDFLTLKLSDITAANAEKQIIYAYANGLDVLITNAKLLTDLKNKSKTGDITINAEPHLALPRFQKALDYGFLPKLDDTTKKGFLDLIKNDPNKNDELPRIVISSLTKPPVAEAVQRILDIGCLPVLDPKLNTTLKKVLVKDTLTITQPIDDPEQASKLSNILMTLKPDVNVIKSDELQKAIMREMTRKSTLPKDNINPDTNQKSGPDDGTESRRRGP
jgi:hypothetical protein